VDNTYETLRAAGVAVRGFLEGLLGLQPPSAAPARPEASKNREAIDRFVEEVVNQQRFDKIEEYFAPDFVDYFQPPGYPPGMEGVRQRFEAFSAAFKLTSSERPIVFTHEDFLVQIGRTNFKHTGDWMGMASTNRDVSVDGVEIHRFRDGKVVERWGMWNVVGLADQVGAMLTPVPQPEGGMTALAAQRRIQLG